MMTDHDTEADPEAHLSPDHGALIDRIRDCLREQANMPDAAGPVVISAETTEKIRERIDADAKHYAHHMLAWVRELDANSIVHRLYDTCPEIVGSPGDVRVRWRTKHGTRNGDIVYGTCKAIPARERILAKQEGQEVYLWEVTLALDVWILLTPEGRERLVHHELMHIALDEEGIEPKVRSHEIEEFGATAARFGLAPWQVRPVSLAMAHPETRQAVKTWVAGPDDAPLLGSWQTVN